VKIILKSSANENEQSRWKACSNTKRCAFKPIDIFVISALKGPLYNNIGQRPMNKQNDLQP
jgi:hypothetical protein